MKKRLVLLTLLGVVTMSQATPTSFGCLAPTNYSMDVSVFPQIQWQASTDSSGVTYSLQMGSDPLFGAGTYTEIQHLSGTSYYPDPDLRRGVLYFWRVMAISGDGDTTYATDWSNPWAFQTIADTVEVEIDAAQPIAANRTLIQENSPYTINGYVRVLSRYSLTIRPGVTLKFKTSTSGLWIDGEIIARGHLNDSIFFESSGSQAAGKWLGIELKSTAKPTVLNEQNDYVSGSVFEYVRVQSAGASSHSGIQSAVRLGIQNAKIVSNAADGIHFSSQNGWVQNAVITNNGGHGLAGVVTCHQVVSSSNGKHGIYDDNGIYPISLSVVQLDSNGLDGAHIATSAEVRLEDLSARFNQGSGLNTTADAIQVLNVNTSYNRGNGQWLSIVHKILIDEDTSQWNGGYGVLLANDTNQSAISVNQMRADSNGTFNAEIKSGGSIAITNSSFVNASLSFGLKIAAQGNTHLSNVQVDHNSKLTEFPFVVGWKTASTPLSKVTESGRVQENGDWLGEWISPSMTFIPDSLYWEPVYYLTMCTLFYQLKADSQWNPYVEKDTIPYGVDRFKVRCTGPTYYSNGTERYDIPWYVFADKHNQIKAFRKDPTSEQGGYGLQIISKNSLDKRLVMDRVSSCDNQLFNMLVQGRFDLEISNSQFNGSIHANGWGSKLETHGKVTVNRSLFNANHGASLLLGEQTRGIKLQQIQVNDNIGAGLIVNGSHLELSYSSLSRNVYSNPEPSEFFYPEQVGALTLNGHQSLLSYDTIVDNQIDIKHRFLPQLNYRGAGITIAGNDHRIEKTMISNNEISLSNSLAASPVAYGGGIAVLEGSSGTQICNNHIMNNHIQGESMSYGGGIWIQSQNDQLRIEQNVFQGNSAQKAGGGLYVNSADAVIDGNLIHSNAVDGDGGGLWTRSSVLNSIFYKNTANQGAGLWADTSIALLKGNTFTRNISLAKGGAVYAKTSIGEVSNNIITHNQGSTGGLWGYCAKLKYNNI